jgi:hypothetical protein
MLDREYWSGKLAEAERDVEAARKRSNISAAAKRLMLARQELKLLDGVPAEQPKGAGKRSARR